MINHKLVDYIVRFTHRGGTLEQAKQKLVQAGHKQPHVDEAASKVKRRKNQEVGVIILGVIILIAIIGLVVNELFQKESEPLAPSHDRLLLAIQEGDISACDQFNPVKRDVCRRSILGEIGGDNPPKLPPEQPIIEQAALLQDPSLCEGILSFVQKEKCLILSGGVDYPEVERYVENPETGELEPTEYQIVEDITAEAAATGDSSLCSQITNPVKRQRCEIKST